MQCVSFFHPRQWSRPTDRPHSRLVPPFPAAPPCARRQEGLEGITDNQNMGNFFASSSGGGGAAAARVGHAGRRMLIIMDEVDGMSSGDVGGNAELIKIIKATRTPIICICNDRNKPSSRSLANSCYDLKFARPPLPAVCDRVMAIARAEGLAVEQRAVEQLVESCGSDIRQVGAPLTARGWG